MQSRCPWGFPAPVRCDLVQLLHKCVWESAVLKGRWKVSTSLSSFTWIQEAIWNMVKHHDSKYHWEAPCSTHQCTHHGYFLRLHGGRKHYASSRLPSCTLLKLRAFEARESPRRPKVNLGFLFRLVYRCNADVYDLYDHWGFPAGQRSCCMEHSETAARVADAQMLSGHPGYATFARCH